MVLLYSRPESTTMTAGYTFLRRYLMNSSFEFQAGDIVEYIKSENLSTRQESVLYNHEMNSKIHKGNLFIVHKTEQYKTGERVIFIQ